MDLLPNIRGTWVIESRRRRIITREIDFWGNKILKLPDYYPLNDFWGVINARIHRIITLLPIIMGNICKQSQNYYLTGIIQGNKVFEHAGNRVQQKREMRFNNLISLHIQELYNKLNGVSSVLCICDRYINFLLLSLTILEVVCSNLREESV